MLDVFEPRSEPAKSIYLAFQNEAANRKGRELEEWVNAERNAVHRECVHQAEKLGLVAPTIEQVAAAERYAMGSIDYGAKWAHQLVKIMQPLASSGGVSDKAAPAKTKPFSFAEVPMQSRCRWFVRRGAATHFDRGFRAKDDASNWIDAMGTRLDWRSGFTFRVRGDSTNIEIVDRKGNVAKP